jgi:uncharacterized protein YecE (DUF72 family)
MNLHIGTSGFGYKEWKGKFFPPDIKPAEMLRFYAERFNAVEINNTFYRMPKKELLEGWLKEVPSSFIFGLKAPQKITHIRRLKESQQELDYFLEVASVLKNQLGPLLFQLPPNFKKDADRLRNFLKLLPADRRVTFEFRHESWFDDETFAALKEHNAALCIAESEDPPQTPFQATADWGYFRLRRLDYTDADLKSWSAKIQSQKNWSDSFVFFKHEEQAFGPKFAQTFQRMSGTS